MTTLTLNTVRYYTLSDVYHYTVDNRPLQDLASNDGILLNAILRATPQLVTVTGSTTAPTGCNVTIFYNQALTTNATITAEASPQNGDILRIVRSANATGAFNVTFNGKSLTTAGTSIMWQYDGSNWQEISYSTLI
jgi:hypothetical protein